MNSVHTQTIEAFWSIIKRGIVNNFHKVSPKYLPLYVAEFQFRYNVSGATHQTSGLIPYIKGQSGNPSGRYVTRAVRRAGELYETFLIDLGGAETLIGDGQAFLAQACRLMAQAETNRNAEDAVRLSNAAARMLGKLRDRRRKEAALTFDQYLARGKSMGSLVGGPGYQTAAKTETPTSDRLSQLTKPPRRSRRDPP